jgi:ADP-ribose pyrophosphatase
MRLRVEAEREVYRGRVVRLVERKLVLPNGRKTTFAVVEHPGAVAVVPVFENGDVLLIKQFRPAIDREIYEIPAGTLEPGEKPLATAKREIVEETGFKAKRWRKLTSCYTAPGFCTELIHIYEARGLSPASAPGDADEILRPVRVSRRDALAYIRRGLIRDAKSITGLLVLHHGR